MKTEHIEFFKVVIVSFDFVLEMKINLQTLFALNICLFCSVICQSNDSEFKGIDLPCNGNIDIFKCLKLQALKITDTILSKPSMKLINGIKIVSSNDLNDIGRNVIKKPKISTLKNSDIDEILMENARNIVKNQNLEINFSKILSSGLQEGKNIIESRGKKYKKYLGPFVAALAIKGGILTMVYHSIAIIAGMENFVQITRVQILLLGLKAEQKTFFGSSKCFETDTN